VRRPAADRPERLPGITDDEIAHREALLLWLRWNDAYERVTEQLFQIGDDPAAAEAMMDQLDALRREAASKSRALLD
jgi:hypothetical protein